MTPEELSEIARVEREKQQQVTHSVRVCVAAACMSQRSEQLKIDLAAGVQQRGLPGCEVKGVGCMGLCAAGPLVSVHPQGCLYQRVQPEAPHVSAILDSLQGHAAEPLLLPTDTPFFTRQTRIVLENSGLIDPERIEDYIAVGGYEQLLRVLTAMNRQEVIEQITRSGLRGRGGAGYPTGLKWSTVAKARAGEKYVICNADEGDPGAFMDRSVLESDPHRVLEGMAIAAYAVGASRGYIYVRAEYPLAVKRLKTAIRQAENQGLLGGNISDTNFSFKIEIRLGAGAFVCGEETALIASVEGNRGTPRPRPPYPAQAGLWGSPTLINNVESFANVPAILRRGADWFASIGTEKSKGTKVFALAGRVRNTGLIEVPMGTPLREVVFELGGGIPDGRRFKAAQTGGPSGGCIPEQHLDLKLDYESLVGVGSIMGSGGLIIMDDSSCMVDVARFFMDFCRTESCGKCAPCRVGTTHLHNLLARIAHGEGSEADLALLEQIGDLVKQCSLCGLGQTAPNPVFSTLRFFRDEYIAHAVQHRCPAGVCPIVPVPAEVGV
ncbi:MAG TPA: NADH-quinone oxidoreductase subunit NuoF [Terriglobales bacterium]|nr:NADH-quinone oxidoreductase subunit NuoF [Terriglobales bacterium]